MLEKKVYTNWAFDENAKEKATINRKIYEELLPKVKRCFVDCKTKKSNCTTTDLQMFCCIEHIGDGYGHMKCRVLSNPYNFTDDELALIMDSGNLCFGYRKASQDIFCIYID